MSGSLRRKGTAAVIAGGTAWVLWGAAFPDLPASNSNAYQRESQAQYRQSQELEAGSRELRRRTLQDAIQADALRSAAVRRAEASGVARILVRRP